ncbi:MAG: hypothetical protein BYD32DRAFT_135469 [Podila humilis]|nr:MAG: hypothetical protein BYD32DRAFT_135469 [Podila humilis]
MGKKVKGKVPFYFGPTMYRCISVNRVSACHVHVCLLRLFSSLSASVHYPSVLWHGLFFSLSFWLSSLGCLQRLSHTPLIVSFWSTVQSASQNTRTEELPHSPCSIPILFFCEKIHTTHELNGSERDKHKKYRSFQRCPFVDRPAIELTALWSISHPLLSNMSRKKHHGAMGAREIMVPRIKEGQPFSSASTLKYTSMSIARVSKLYGR